MPINSNESSLTGPAQDRGLGSIFDDLEPDPFDIAESQEGEEENTNPMMEAYHRLMSENNIRPSSLNASAQLDPSGEMLSGFESDLSPAELGASQGPNPSILAGLQAFAQQPPPSQGLGLDTEDPFGAILGQDARTASPQTEDFLGLLGSR